MDQRIPFVYNQRPHQDPLGTWHPPPSVPGTLSTARSGLRRGGEDVPCEPQRHAHPRRRGPQRDLPASREDAESEKGFWAQEGRVRKKSLSFGQDMYFERECRKRGDERGKKNNTDRQSQTLDYRITLRIDGRSLRFGEVDDLSRRVVDPVALG